MFYVRRLICYPCGVRESCTDVAEPLFSKTFLSTVSAMVEARDCAVNALVAHRWVVPEKTCWLRLCLEEGLSNAVHHGNCNDPNRHVVLKVFADEEVCRIEIQDEGCGFNLEDAKEPVLDQIGGRGICLMKYFMDNIRYDREKHCLQMVMSKLGCCRQWQSTEGGCSDGRRQ